MDTGKNTAGQGGAVADLTWERWPDGLRAQAQRVIAQWRTGRPGEAVELVDELIADLCDRREVIADSANRVFEPSTDDRNL